MVSYDTVEDDELLAPQGLSEVDDEETQDVEGEWHFAHGFPDTRRAVRIWVDEDSRRLTRVRLSTRWRDRLGTRSLDDAFAEAFFLANARVGEIPELARPEVDEPELNPRLTWDDYETVLERVNSLGERMRDLDSRAPEDVEWPDYEGEKVTASSSNGHVTVTLSLAGLTDSVAIDKGWLTKARMPEIAESVLNAHERAYARYTPPTYIAGDYDRLALELARARADLLSILTKEMP